MKYKHLFGPVISRRLGLSLGVDIVPYKYCSLNCVYCEVSKTTHLTDKRKSFFEPEEILSELDDFLASLPKLDYITFSGAGEPTLNLDLGFIIAQIKQRHPGYKLALITNSTLFQDEHLRQEVLNCDLIVPSLDAVSDAVFEAVNRPCDELSPQDIINGLIALREEYGGEMWLEIFIVPGINDHLEEIELLKQAMEMIKPNKVQLNSLDRPGVEEWVEPAVYLALEEIRAILQDGIDIPIEIISKVHQEISITDLEMDAVNEIKLLLQSDEYSKAELAKTLQIHVNEVSKILQYLALSDSVYAVRTKKGIFYQWKR